MADRIFHLIDIATQFEDLEVFLRGTTLEEKERWVASQGELVRLPRPNTQFPAYELISPAGIRWSFGIDGDQIIVFGDHTIITRKKEA